MAEMEGSRLDVLLIGYERQENLGLRSIMAHLRDNGYRVAIVPYGADAHERVLSAVQAFTPRIVGFSLIFQYSLDDFGTLMRFLRTQGVSAHFTAGGHFPTLCPAETFELLPELDTIVRFEGEHTLLELLKQLEHPDLWGRIPGLAMRRSGEVLLTETRPLIKDLDALPLLSRDEPQQTGHGVKVAAMLASRGCLFNCSFCSIRQFYGSARGELRRVRSPRGVVEEMLLLHQKHGVTFFSFQDDDFAARSPEQRRWLGDFLTELDRARLTGKIGWKISCRVDDLAAEPLQSMIDHGLCAVYLGVESGNATGLKTLNKQVSVAQNLAAIELLKEHDLAMAIGFMLFDPSSTIDSVRENIGFLRSAGEDGYFPINFCKMLPYAGTPIEKALKKEGRLKGSVARPDYSFDHPCLDWYEFLVQQAFQRRNFAPEGLVALLQQADFDWRVDSFLGVGGYEYGFGAALKGIIRDSNMVAIDTLESLLLAVLSRGIASLLDDTKALVALFEREWQGEMEAEVKLLKLLAQSSTPTPHPSAVPVDFGAPSSFPPGTHSCPSHTAAAEI